MLDAVIIGAGHNGLVAGFYLARAGLKVRIVEARGVVGGAAVTEEFAPGYRNSVASYTVSLLQPRIVADMALADHGYRVVSRPLSNFLPLGQGAYLKVGGGLSATQAEVAKFSRADAAALPAYYAALETVADVLRDLALKTPPNAGGGVRALLAVAAQGRAAARLPLAAQRDLHALFTHSARQFLDAWFESAPIKAAFGFDAVVGNFASPDTPGSAYVLLHHVFGEVNGVKGAWGHAVGGMGAITQAMAAACRTVGVDVVTDAPVARVTIADGRANGVRLASGETIAAKRVVANVTPKLLFGALVDAADLPPDFRRRIAATRYGSGSFRMNVALSELPDFSDLPGAGDHHASGIIVAPSLGYMERAFDDARRDGWSRQPIVEMTIPSTVDDSLAPPGHHVASLFAQHFAYDLPGGRSWDDERDAAADAIIDTVNAAAPNFRASIVARTALSPLDLERTFGLTRGDIFHGAMGLDQLWSARPVLGSANYRSPIRGLYLCGSGSHPGGGVSGAPGHNAAHEILRDIRAFAGRWPS